MIGESRNSRLNSGLNSVVAIAVLTVACLTAGVAWAESSTEIHDPWEGMNRGTFRFNEGADRWFFEPVAKGWDFIMPDPVERSIDRFFENATFPVRFVNDVLQFKPAAAAEDLGRFLINTTIGLAGFFDPAAKLGIEGHREDFGQTLGYWGIPPGPYLVLPILGPSNPRDTVGRLGDMAAMPHSYFLPFWMTSAIQATYLLNWRSLHLDEIASERAAALDFYVFQRNAYMQYRENQVHDRKQGEMSDDSYMDDELYYPDQSDEQ